MNHAGGLLAATAPERNPSKALLKMAGVTEAGMLVS